jgi:tRNA (guanine37-N1)-methyltransferase
MLCIRVPKKEAEPVKIELISKDLLDKEYRLVKDKEFVYFPIKKRFDTGYELVNKFVKRKPLQTGLRAALSAKLSKEELELLKSSMDIIGSIAILEIPKELERREKLIAGEALRTNKNIKTVLKKGKHEGIFRTQKLEHLAGEKTKEASYKEHGVILKLDVEKVYFSPRLSNERKRVYEQVKKGEEVLVMFSGCSPYTCVIAKNTPAKSVTGVEINPTAHNYALQNMLLNKLSNVNVFLGDVKHIIPKLKKKYDRIIMPLPKSAADYLDVAFKAAKKGAIIHFYDFQREGEEKKSVEKIRKACKLAKKKCKIMGIVKCGQASPREFRICIDFEMT